MAAPTTPDPHVIDVDAASFPKEVVERSKTQAVLVDLWATWCAPCRTLSPVLEKLAKESAGQFVLAKIDIDANPELADAFGVQSVPTVMLVKQGQLVDGFLGALPEAEIRSFLAKHLGPAVNPLERADELEKDGKVDEAISLLRDHVRKFANDGAARLALARLLLDQGEKEEALRVFGLLAAADKESEAGRALAERFAFAEQHAGELARLERTVREAPADLAAAIAYGRALVAAGEHEAGLETLMAAARKDLGFDGGAPRKALVEAFGIVGSSNPLVREYQRKLSLLLAS